MVRRGEITDEAWERIAPLLPEGGRRGGRLKDHRPVVNGILWKLRTGGRPGATRPSATAPGRPARWTDHKRQILLHAA
jgi:transposase